MPGSRSQMTIRELTLVQVVDAAVVDVWQAFTTEAGVITFFAPAASIELRQGGRYEIYFDGDEPPGKRGSEGCSVVAFEPPNWLAVSWNFPPVLPSIRDEHTEVGIGLQALEDGRTRVVLSQRGWKAGPDWDEGFRYFSRAWKVVLARLQHRFTHGPIDWQAPFTPAV
jgi:uncharacterized protein YndB with AHSA1/START domain